MDSGFDQGGFVLAKHYRLLDKLGEGSFGQLYECQDIQTKKQFAAKLEPIQESQSSQLRYQAKIYQILQGSNGICRIYESGVQDTFNYLIMEKLSISLDQLLAKSNGKFSHKTMLMVADQLVSRLEFLHMKGFVHRDLKPNNFMLGCEEKRRTIYIIDFGLAKRYTDFKTNEHIAQKTGKSLVGTARYASIASHQGLEQCRRDDLESLGYLLLYFVKGCLPWQGIQTKKKVDKFDSIGNVKKTTPLNKLCEGYEDLQNYLSYVRQLSFTEQPDYNLIRKIFRQSFVSKGYQPDYFEWQLPLQVNGQKPVPNKPLTKKPF